MRSLPLPAMVHLTRLPGRVTRDVAGLTEHLGLRDYAGRSYRGCHHHLTLVSVAQMVAVLHTTTERPPRPRAA